MITDNEPFIPYGVLMHHPFVNEDFLANSNDRFITYTPDLDTLNWKDENIHREFEQHPELWF